MDIKAEVARLKRERNAVVLAHNYTRGEVQELADFTGDSLELARKATQVDAETIVFCGVYFMAETAAILNPEKTVLIPDANAGCAMADMVSGAQLRELKARHPNAVTVSYVNSTAEVKAECDLCVTSGNAAKVMATVPAEREVLFVPDKHLGGYISALEGRKYVLWDGFCPVHAALTMEAIAKTRAAHPGAPVLVHPECSASVRDAADERLSTGGMCAYARESSAPVIIVGTETGILHRLRKENPTKTFVPVSEDVICPDMKLTTAESLLASLWENKTVVTVPPEVAARARKAIDAMLAIS